MIFKFFYLTFLFYLLCLLFNGRYINDNRTMTCLSFGGEYKHCIEFLSIKNGQ